MRNVYLVCYDVANDKRLRRTFKKMCGFGDPLQYSVFRCELSPPEKQMMKMKQKIVPPSLSTAWTISVQMTAFMPPDQV